MGWKSEDHTSLGDLRTVWPACLLATADSRAVAALNSLTADEWNRLIDEALRHDVAVYLHYHLGELQDSVDVPQYAQERLRQIARQATVLSLRREHELRQILATLNDGGITPTLLKGAALAHTVYPAPACRSMVDFDLWLADEEMPEARARLEKLGYQFKPDPTRTIEFCRRYEGELAYVSPRDGRTSVELHWGAFVGEWIRRTTKVDREAVAARRCVRNINDLEVQLLAPEDAFLQILLHAAIHHQMSLHALRSFLDLGLLLRSGAKLTVIVERAQEWQIETVTNYALGLMACLLDISDIQTLLESARIGALDKHVVLSILGPDDVRSRISIDTHRKRYVFLALLADRSQDALTLFARMMWPETDWIRLRYGQSGLAVRLRHCGNAFFGKL